MYVYLSQLYQEKNYSFLFHWQYFVVPKEKQIIYIDGRWYTGETQTSDTRIRILCFFCRYRISPCLAETQKISHSLQLNYF